MTTPSAPDLSPARETLRSYFAEPARQDVTHLLPDLGIRVFVQEMSGPDRAEWFRVNEERRTASAPDDSEARLVAVSLVDEAGRKLLTAEDIPALARRSAVTAKLANAAGHVSGLYKEESLKNDQATSPSSQQPPGEV